MNPKKRARISALSVLVTGLIDEEEQDLSDTPDNIENSSASVKFRASIAHLEDAYDSLTKAKQIGT